MAWQLKTVLLVGILTGGASAGLGGPAYAQSQQAQAPAAEVGVVSMGPALHKIRQLAEKGDVPAVVEAMVAVLQRADEGGYAIDPVPLMDLLSLAKRRGIRKTIATTRNPSPRYDGTREPTLYDVPPAVERIKAYAADLGIPIDAKNNKLIDDIFELSKDRIRKKANSVIKKIRLRKDQSVLPSPYGKEPDDSLDPLSRQIASLHRIAGDAGRQLDERWARALLDRVDGAIAPTLEHWAELFSTTLSEEWDSPRGPEADTDAHTNATNQVLLSLRGSAKRGSHRPKEGKYDSIERVAMMSNIDYRKAGVEPLIGQNDHVAKVVLKDLMAEARYIASPQLQTLMEMMEKIEQTQNPRARMEQAIRDAENTVPQEPSVVLKTAGHEYFESFNHVARAKALANVYKIEVDPTHLDRILLGKAQGVLANQMAYLEDAKVNHEDVWRIRDAMKVIRFLAETHNLGVPANLKSLAQTKLQRMADPAAYEWAVRKDDRPYPDAEIVKTNIVPLLEQYDLVSEQEKELQVYVDKRLLEQKIASLYPEVLPKTLDTLEKTKGDEAAKETFRRANDLLSTLFRRRNHFGVRFTQEQWARANGLVGMDEWKQKQNTTGYFFGIDKNEKEANQVLHDKLDAQRKIKANHETFSLGAVGKPVHGWQTFASPDGRKKLIKKVRSRGHIRW